MLIFFQILMQSNDFEFDLGLCCEILHSGINIFILEQFSILAFIMIIPKWYKHSEATYKIY